MSGMNRDPKEIWGAKLERVFGFNVTERRNIAELSYDEKQEILRKVPKYVSTDHLGRFPSLYEVANEILKILAQTKAVQGIDLNWQDKLGLVVNGLRRPREMYKSTDQMFKNNNVQRGIMLRHLLKDIMFVYNPKKVLTGLARYDVAAEKYYMNDAQHRNVTSIILGVRQIPVEYEESSDESVDVEQYGCVNINSLVASEFDKWRNRVQMVITSANENKDVDSLDPEYRIAHSVYEIAQVQAGIKIVEKGATSERMTCSGIGNLVRDYERYGNDIFERATRIIAQTMHKANGGIPQAGIEMVCKFLETQSEVDQEEIVIDMAVESAIRHWCPTSNRTGLHLEARKACVNGIGGAHDLNVFTEQDLQAQWASGVLKLVRVLEPNINWKPIVLKDYDVAAELMADFEVMPLQMVA
jgi:hypothetical protein